MGKKIGVMMIISLFLFILFVFPILIGIPITQLVGIWAVMILVFGYVGVAVYLMGD